MTPIADPSAGISSGFWSAGEIEYATAKVRTRDGLVVRHVRVTEGRKAALETARNAALLEAQRRRLEML